MTDELVKAPVAEKKVKAPKEPKAPKAPKATRFTNGWTAETWAEKLASMSVPTVPDGYLIMSEIVKKAQEAGIKTGRICMAMGGDRCAKEPWAPVFQVVYVGGRKYGSPEILTRGFELLADPEFHKPARRGKSKKEGEPSAESADGGETSAPVQPVKLKVTPPGSTSWNDKKD
ncbi:MAG TPA: hypothetical protein VJ044_20490 [Candidatus Hodarchaeales archaeon]|nr:hypothetical protein [Candidatus Hodarchaeales archaeon]